MRITKKVKDKVEKIVLEFAKAQDMGGIHDLCYYSEYDPDVGSVPGYWRIHPLVYMAVLEVLKHIDE